MADLLYYESGYVDSNYFVYTADAALALSGTPTLTATASVIKEASVDLIVTSSVTGTISHIEGADLFAMSNAALAAQVQRIRDNNVQVSSQFNVAIDASRVRYVSAEEDSSFVIALAPDWVRNTQAAVDAAFSLAAINNRTRDTSSNLTASTSLTSQEDYLRLATADLNTTSQLACDATRIAGGVVIEAYGTWSLTVSLTASISHIHGIDIQAFTNASLTVPGQAERNAQASLAAISQAGSQANISSSLVASLTCLSSISTTSNRLRSTTATFNLSSTLNASLGIVKQFVSIENAAFTPSLTVDTFKNSFAVLDSTTAVSAQARVYKSLASAVSSNSSLSANGSLTKTSSISLSSAFTQSALGEIAPVNWLALIGNSSSNFILQHIARDSNNNIFAAGANGGDLQVVKYNKYGALLWQYNYGTSSTDQINDIAVAPDGNLYLVGRSLPTGDTIGFLLKIDTNGSLVWARSQTSANADGTFALDVDSSSNVYIAGQFNSISTGSPFVVKYDTSGTILYRKILSNGNYAVDIKVKGSYVYVATPSTVIKMSLDGTTVSGVYTNSEINNITSLAIDSSDNLYVNGYSSSTATQQTLIKYNSSGVRQWTIVNQLARFPIIAIDADNNIVGAGLIDTPRDFAVVKYAPTGSLIWQKSIVGSASDLAYGITISTSGELLVAGYSNSDGINYKAIVASLAPNGSGQLSGIFTYSYENPTIITKSTASTTSTYTTSTGGPTQVTNSSFSSFALSNTSSLTEIINSGTDVSFAASLTSSATVSSTVSKVRNVTASLSSASSISLTVDSNIKTTSANLSANGFVFAVIGKIIPEFAGLESTTALTARVGVIKQQASAITSRFTLSAIGLDLDLAQANLVSTSSLTAQLSAKILGGVAGLQSNALVLANASENPNPNLGYAPGGFTISFQVYIPNGVTKTFGAGFSTDDRLLGLGYSYDTPQAGSVSVSYQSGTSFAQVSSSQFRRTTSPKAEIVLVGANWSIPTTFMNSLPTQTWFTVTATVPGAITNTSVPTGTTLVINGTAIESTYTQVISPLGNPAGPEFNLSLSPTRAYLPAVDYVPDSFSTIQFRNVTYTPLSQYAYRLITVIASADLAARTTMTSNIIRVKINSCAMSSRFTSTAVIGKKGNAVANLTTSSTASITATKISRITKNLTATSTVVSNATKKTVNTLGLSSQSSLVANVSRLRNNNVTAVSAFSQLTTAKKTARTSPALNLTATLVAPPYNFTKATASISSTSTLTLVPLRIQKSAVNLQAFVTELAITNKIGRGFIHFDSPATMTVDPYKSAVVSANLANQTNLLAQVQSTLFAESHQQASLTVTANVDKLRRMESIMAASSSLTCNLVTIRRSPAVLATSTNLTADTINSKITQGAADLTARATVVTNNQIARLAQSNMQASTALWCVAGVAVRFEIHMQAFDTQLTAGKVIHIDPYYQLVIKGETRRLTVLEETREITIKQETRVNKIRGLKQ